ncbi:MAG TPA: nuclear transport factor 2 family protein [Gemmatimonadota bacterium]|nr:nuclear transport factor 2 family protein [Gemmatimonadota bacterium]
MTERRRIVTLPAVALGVALACGSSSLPPAEQADEAHLRGLVAAFDSAWQAKDSARVASLLASDYAYVTSTGRLSPRLETLEFLQDPTYHLTHVARSDVDVRIAGPVARVTSRWEGRGEYRGNTVDDDQTCGQTWVWLEGHWQLFTEHCVNRPGSEDPAK